MEGVRMFGRERIGKVLRVEAVLGVVGARCWGTVWR